MKKRVVICLVATGIFVLMLCGCATTNSVAPQTMTQTIPYDTRAIETPASINEWKNGDIFYGEFVYDDSISLEAGITKEYDLTQLEAFFLKGDFNEAGVIYPDSSVLSFSSVNASFPVEIIRTNNYSVYKVKQGGFFYVFWMVAANANRVTTEPYVRFSAYLPGNKTEEMFLFLKPGVSTSEDVMKIDPSAELCFDRSPLCSNSYINNETILTIYYTVPSSEMVSSKDYWDYSDLLVKEMILRRRVWSPSCYTNILSADLP